MKGEFGLIINIDLKGALHKLLAYGSHFLGEGGAEHHDLFLSGRCTKDFLDITAHI